MTGHTVQKNGEEFNWFHGGDPSRVATSAARAGTIVACGDDRRAMA